MAASFSALPDARASSMLSSMSMSRKGSHLCCLRKRRSSRSGSWLAETLGRISAPVVVVAPASGSVVSRERTPSLSLRPMAAVGRCLTAPQLEGADRSVVRTGIDLTMCATETWEKGKSHAQTGAGTSVYEIERSGKGRPRDDTTLQAPLSSVTSHSTGDRRARTGVCATPRGRGWELRGETECPDGAAGGRPLGPWAPSGGRTLSLPAGARAVPVHVHVKPSRQVRAIRDAMVAFPFARGNLCPRSMLCPSGRGQMWIVQKALASHPHPFPRCGAAAGGLPPKTWIVTESGTATRRLPPNGAPSTGGEGLRLWPLEGAGYTTESPLRPRFDKPTCLVGQAGA